jgi:ribonuclease HI
MVSNNIVEAYALYEGVCIAKEKNVSKIVVFGDSMMVVRAINKRS